MDLDKLLQNLHHHPTTNKEMIEKQIRARGINETRLLQAFQAVDRKIFVPKKYHSLAYADQPVSIGNSQTISQPYIVAFMTEYLDLKESSKVLEIGTGCGYQTAILAQLAKDIFTIEVIPELAELAKSNLRKCNINNYTIFNQNGRKGLPDYAPFDRIIVTAGGNEIPTKLIDQLADNGKMIIPIGAKFDHQELILITKEKNKIKKESILPVRFVPLV